MRAFPVPIQIIEEEKIFGGHLSLRQVAYVFLLGPGIGGAFAIACPIGNMAIKLIIFALIWSVGLAMAYIKVAEMGLDTYLWLAFRWWRSPQRYQWERRI